MICNFTFIINHLKSLMKIIISPAKSLDFENKVPTSLHTQPQFLEYSEKLNKKLKTLSRKKLADLMSI